MSSLLTLRNTDSLDSIWEELVYTEAKLLADDAGDTKRLAKPVSDMIKRWSKIRDDRYGHWRNEVVADAKVDTADQNLDEATIGVSDALERATGSTSDARYKRYFKGALNLLTRLGLASQLARLAGWPASLSSEPEKEVKDTGKKLGIAMKAGDEAITTRTEAISGRADHFARELTSFVDDVNALREGTLAALITVAQSRKKRGASAWALRFFRRSSRGASEAPTPPTPPTPAAS